MHLCRLQVPPVLRAFHAHRAEMASFVTSLQYYIVFEVPHPAHASPCVCVCL